MFAIAMILFLFGGPSGLRRAADVNLRRRRLQKWPWLQP
jgi:hypothetical protein